MGVIDRLHPGDDPEKSEEDRQRCPQPRPNAWGESAKSQEQGHRNEPADEMISCRRGGLRLQEVVVEHVDRDDQEGRSQDELLPAESGE